MNCVTAMIGAEVRNAIQNWRKANKLPLDFRVPTLCVYYTKEIMKIENVFSDFEIVEIGEKLAKKVLNGISLPVEDFGLKNAKPKPFLIKYNSDIVGLYENQKGKIKPIAFVYDV